MKTEKQDGVQWFTETVSGKDEKFDGKINWEAPRGSFLVPGVDSWNEKYYFYGQRMLLLDKNTSFQERS